jgi:hypothetical protein
MRHLVFLTVIAVALLLANAAHADEPTFTPDPSARYRVELGGGLVDEGGGRPVIASTRLGVGFDLGAHVGLVFDARHLFVETRNPHPIDDARESYDDFGLGLRLRAPLGRQVELFLTPMLLASRFGYERSAVWGKGAELRAGIEVWLGGVLWVGASAGGTLSWASEESVEANGNAEAYVTARF